MLRILKQIKARLKGTSYQNQYCIEVHGLLSVQKLGTSTESRSKDANVSFDDQLIPLVVFIQICLAIVHRTVWNTDWMSEAVIFACLL